MQNSDFKSISDAMEMVAGVQAVHAVHVSPMATGRLCLSVHVICPDSQARSVAAAIRQMVAESFGILHTTIQCESVGCEWPDVLKEESRALARIDGRAALELNDQSERRATENEVRNMMAIAAIRKVRHWVDDRLAQEAAERRAIPWILGFIAILVVLIAIASRYIRF